MEHSLFPLPQIQEFLKGNLDMTNITIEVHITNILDAS